MGLDFCVNDAECLCVLSTGCMTWVKLIWNKSTNIICLQKSAPLHTQLKKHLFFKVCLCWWCGSYLFTYRIEKGDWSQCCAAIQENWVEKQVGIQNIHFWVRTSSLQWDSFLKKTCIFKYNFTVWKLPFMFPLPCLLSITS